LKRLRDVALDYVTLRIRYFRRMSEVQSLILEHEMRKLIAALTIGSVGACSDSSGPDAGPPAALLVLAGARAQVGTFGQPLAIRPTVLVVDASNLPVPGISVSFATTGGATIDAPVQKTTSNGSASVAWTMGNTFGSRTLTANVQGLEPVTFSASAIAPDAGVVAFAMTDPASDTLPVVPGFTKPAIDLVALRGDFKRDSLIITATFSGPVSSGSSAANAIGGYIEIDIDDNPNTGVLPVSNFYGATANVGVEYQLSLFASNGFSLDLFGMDSGTTVGASFSGNTVVARIPMSRLSLDDGNFSIVGIIGNTERPTDLVPNTGQTQIRRGLLFGASSANVLFGQGRIFSPVAGSLPWGRRSIR